MKLARDDWSSVLRLLDEALELPPPQRDGWLAALKPELQRLQPALRQLLDERRAIETGDFMRELPPLPPSLPLDSGFSMGHRIGPYAVLRELGQGGMASVWLAERADGAHGREVALKLPHLGARARVIGERFARERKILSALTHPHIASVLDAGTDGAQPWLAMEYVDGRPITEWATQQRLDVPARLRLFLQVLQAVQHAHAQLVIHRDIKPSNVLVDASGQVKLLDFGVAKLLGDDGATTDTELTQLGGRALTPQYASPEQVAGQPLGTASDVYSLGVLLYELLTGRLPYTLKRATPAALEEAILASQVMKPSQAVATDAQRARALRGDMDTLVLKAMAQRVPDRYSSVEALSEDIQRHLDARPILAQPASWTYLAAKFARRHVTGLIVASGAFCLVATGIAATLWQARRAEASAKAFEATARKADIVKKFLAEVLGSVTSGEFAESPEMRKRMTAALRRKMGEARTRFADSPEERAAVHEVLGNLFSMIDDTQDAHTAWSEALAAHEASGGSRSARAAMLTALAVNAYNERDYEVQRQYLERALHVFDAGRLDAEERLAKGLAIGELGDSLIMVNQMTRAKAVLDEGRNLLETEYGKTIEYAGMRRGLGLIGMLTGRPEVALDHFRAAVAAVQADPQSSANDRARLVYELAKVETANGLARDAEAHARAAYEAEFRESGESQALPAHRAGLAEALAAQSRFDEADALFDQALKAFAGEPPQGEAKALFRTRLSAAGAALDHGDLRRADGLLSLARATLAAGWVTALDRMTFWRHSAILHGLRGETDQELAAATQALAQQTGLDAAFDEQRARTSLLVEHAALDARHALPGERAAWVTPSSVDPLIGQRIGARFVQARQQFERREFAGASTAFAALLSSYQAQEAQRRKAPVEARLQFELGRALTALGRTDEARPVLQAALENLANQHPDSPRRIGVQRALSQLGVAAAR